MLSLVVAPRVSTTNVRLLDGKSLSKQFPWKTKAINHLYCMYILSIEFGNDASNKTPNSDTSKGSIAEKN
ncbi:hypothetical protein D3C87_1191450 [compost metagenome]